MAAKSAIESYPYDFNFSPKKETKQKLFNLLYSWTEAASSATHEQLFSMEFSEKKF